MKNSVNSINFLNKTLFIAILLLNIFFVYIVLITVDYLMITYITILNGFLNVLLFGLYFYVNSRYQKDLSSLVRSFKDFIDNKTNSIGANKPIFIENKSIETLFKNISIKNNLLKKDFKDLKNVFEKFIPQDIYKEIGFKGYEKVILGSCISKNLTVMFLDIVGFTTMSENITPERTLLLLNIYFDGIGEIIYKNGGYIDKFLGDGIMIIFEAENSDNSIICAIEIQDFIKKFQISTIGKKINIGIGINSGEVIVGTIGTKKRMDATVIGDSVNISSRLEGLTRKFSKSIIISENTFDLIKNKQNFMINHLGKETLSGRSKDVNIYHVEEFYNVTV
ncbi:MAG: adenylate/guanylate cyclase domain-containing protein [Candidatus Gracilibacteria bacterium]|nr:adenylate/guanylate cyclase domain-containing protein [Candidatus Gracilibacteria bacterium]